MMQNSKYTVLMSVYYKEKPEYLSLSIESMLNQTVKPDEFIIVKDGPLTTELDEVINNFVTAYPKTFNIIVNETNLGLGPALAKGIENSKNDTSSFSNKKYDKVRNDFEEIYLTTVEDKVRIDFKKDNSEILRLSSPKIKNESDTIINLLKDDDSKNIK